MDHDAAISTHAAERYLLEEMSEAERFTFEAHFFDCQPCAEDIRFGAAVADAIRRSMTATAVLPFVPKQASASPPRRAVSSWLAVAAAGALALVAGYQAMVVIPGLREASSPQALAPVVLRPVSRGDSPTVTRPAGNQLVSVAMDVNVDPPQTELIYHLRTDAGADVLTGRAPVPLPGTPLLLVIPGRALTSGPHVLTLRSATDPSTEVGVFRFDVR